MLLGVIASPSSTEMYISAPSVSTVKSRPGIRYSILRTSDVAQLKSIASSSAAVPTSKLKNRSILLAIKPDGLAGGPLNHNRPSLKQAVDG